VLALASVGEAPVAEGSVQIFLRLLARLDHRRAAADREVGIASEAPLLIEGLGRRYTGEADHVHQHEEQCPLATHCQFLPVLVRLIITVLKAMP
jgi:hypothetical protein